MSETLNRIIAGSERHDEKYLIRTGLSAEARALLKALMNHNRRLRITLSGERVVSFSPLLHFKIVQKYYGIRLSPNTQDTLAQRIWLPQDTEAPYHLTVAITAQQQHLVYVYVSSSNAGTIYYAGA